MPVHPQVAFMLSDGSLTHVDEGMLHILIALRDHGVKTQYSCQGNGHEDEEEKAYVLMTVRSLIPLLRMIRSKYKAHAYSDEIDDFISQFLFGHTELRYDSYSKDGEWKNWGIKFTRKWSWAPHKKRWSYSRFHRFRVSFHWPAEQSDLMLQLLKQT